MRDLPAWAEQPRLSVRLSSEDLERELAAEGVELGPGELLTAARQVVSGDVTKTTAFRDGRVRIQDEGSQLVAELVPRGRNDSGLLRCSGRKDADSRGTQS